MTTYNFYVTFPQRDAQRKDGWVLIKNAKSKEQALKFVVREYNNEFANLYDEHDFHEGYFPKGLIEEHDLKAWHDYVI